MRAAGVADHVTSMRAFSVGNVFADKFPSIGRLSWLLVWLPVSAVFGFGGVILRAHRGRCEIDLDVLIVECGVVVVTHDRYFS